jgi:Tfp pilus assembly protein PilN
MEERERREGLLRREVEAAAAAVRARAAEVQRLKEEPALGVSLVVLRALLLEHSCAGLTTGQVCDSRMGAFCVY